MFRWFHISSKCYRVKEKIVDNPSSLSSKSRTLFKKVCMMEIKCYSYRKVQVAINMDIACPNLTNWRFKIFAEEIVSLLNMDRLFSCQSPSKHYSILLCRYHKYTRDYLKWQKALKIIFFRYQNQFPTGTKESQTIDLLSLSQRNIIHLQKYLGTIIREV